MKLTKKQIGLSVGLGFVAAVLAIPELALAATPAIPAGTSLASITQAQMATLVGSDIPNIVEIQIWVKLLRGTMIFVGSGIAVSAFMMFGMNSEKPNMLAMWLGLISGVGIVIGSFFWVNDLMALALKIMFG